MDYPSTAPVPNRVVEMLKDERVELLDEQFEKDFHVYRVRADGGQEGYLIDDIRITEGRGGN